MKEPMDQQNDIFDKLMGLPVLRIFEPFYKKYKEILLYLFFGGLAFFLNIFLFAAIDHLFGISELINNMICWIVCVMFQFFTNRTWVFDGSVDSSQAFTKQLAGFVGGRVFTLFLEEVILVIFITWLGYPALVIKLIAQVVVILLNYVISKLWVFKKQQL